MSSVIYEGEKVNNSIHDLDALSSRFPSVASSVHSLTNAMISCKGFDYIGSGVSSTSFSGEINYCNLKLNELVFKIKNMQEKIVDYSTENDKTKDKSNYNDKNESSKGLLKFINDGFVSLTSTVATAALGFAEGVGEFIETGADLVLLGSSAVASIATGSYDLINNTDYTKEMWEKTKEKVSEKKVENAFNNFYDNNKIGQGIKNNAYGFDLVRGLSNGIGYSSGLITLNMVGGGLVSGLGIGSSGTVGAGQLATTAGVMGFSRGTEDAWADGAGLADGLVYGASTGAWEGVQWGVGAKINQYGGLGDKIASGIFKGGRSGAATRVILDTVDSGLEGFVQPGLKMIYKDYEGDSFAEKYKNSFNENGGWNSVIEHAALGGIMSTGSEMLDARKILKSNIEVKKQYSTDIFDVDNGVLINRNVQIYDDIVNKMNNGNNEWLPIDQFYSYNTVKNNLKNVNEEVLTVRAKNIFRNIAISDAVINKIVKSDGYPHTINKILNENTGMSSVSREVLSNRISSEMFTEVNAARIRAQVEMFNGNFDKALELVSNLLKSDFDQYRDLFVSSYTYSPIATRLAYYNLIDSSISKGLITDEAIMNAKLTYASAADVIGSVDAKNSAEKIFKSNGHLFGTNDVIGSFSRFKIEDTEIEKIIQQNGGVKTAPIPVMDLRKKFNSIIKNNNMPSNYTFTNYDSVRSAKARNLFASVFDDLMGSGEKTRNEAIRVMGKVVNVSETMPAYKLFVYNNDGYSGSHCSSFVINLDNIIVDNMDKSTVLHELGHYLFFSIGEDTPSNYNLIRSEALKNLNDNNYLYKDYLNYINEAKIYSDYKTTQIFKNKLKAKGYEDIIAYKDHLVTKYSSLDLADREVFLYKRTLEHGVATKDTSYFDDSDLDDVYRCAEIDYYSTFSKISDAVNRDYFADINTTSGIVDALSDGNIRPWYGHGVDYYNGIDIKYSYHEAIADYFALRVTDNNSSIGFLRQLLGDDMIDMLEKTYYTMLEMR